MLLFFKFLDIEIDNIKKMYDVLILIIDKLDTKIPLLTLNYEREGGYEFVFLFVCFIFFVGGHVFLGSYKLYVASLQIHTIILINTLSYISAIQQL